MKFGSLFAGIGGIDLGLERAGMEAAWQVEIDDFAGKVLKKHWPDVPLFKDVHDVGRHNLAPVDLIAGGFPCQPHSSAGKGGASRDHRDMWPQFRRVLTEMRPRWVIIENVSNLLSSEKGEFYANMLKDLAEIGYVVEWHTLHASDFGALHKRRRVFVVAYSDSDGLNRQGISKIGTEDLSVAARGYHEKYWAALPMPTDAEDQPSLRRVVDGVPDWVDRIRVVGNSVVPQIFEWIGKQIVREEILMRRR